MQLSGLIEKLQSLFTPAFLVSSVTPLFCFILFNGTFLAQYSDTVNGWVSDYFLTGTANKTIVGACLSVALLVAAYVFSTLNLTLREILEGRHLPKGLTDTLTTSETTRLSQLETQFTELKRDRRRLTRSVPAWEATLRLAVATDKNGKKAVFTEDNATHRDIRALLSQKWRGELIACAQLEAAVKGLAGELTANRSNPEGSDDEQRLDRDFIRLGELFKYAAERLEDEYIRLFNEKEFNFSRYHVSPTQMGNIADSVRSYAQLRYRMNLDFFWSRFQRVLQGQRDFYQTLLDAKTQLDFAVSFFWLTVASTVIWFVLLPFLAHSVYPFIAVAVLGPVLARVWYLVAVQNYRSFADLMRSSVDLFRVSLIEALNIPTPADSAAERELWDKLNHRYCYGEDILISYK